MPEKMLTQQQAKPETLGLDPVPLPSGPLLLRKDLGVNLPKRLRSPGAEGRGRIALPTRLDE